MVDCAGADVADCVEVSDCAGADALDWAGADASDCAGADASCFPHDAAAHAKAALANSTENRDSLGMAVTSRVLPE
jgi:hypothetical protein